MNKLIPTEIRNGMNNEEVVLTSIDVVNKINEFREEEGNRAKKTHADFMKSIEKEIKGLESIGISTKGIFSVSSYEAQDGSRKYKMYTLSKKGAMQMLNKESTYVRYKTQEYIEKLENKLKKPMCMEDVIIYQMQQMKNMRYQLQEMDTKVEETNNKVDSIKDVVSLNPTSWRSDSSRLIAKIAKIQKDFKHIGQLRNESYSLLNKRFGVNLHTRLMNKRRRMLEMGIPEQKCDKLNYLDVIADDKKLIEGYVAIVKEMAIRYGI